MSAPGASRSLPAVVHHGLSHQMEILHPPLMTFLLSGLPGSLPGPLQHPLQLELADQTPILSAGSLPLVVLLLPFRQGPILLQRLTSFGQHRLQSNMHPLLRQDSITSAPEKCTISVYYSRSRSSRGLLGDHILKNSDIRQHRRGLPMQQMSDQISSIES